MHMLCTMVTRIFSQQGSWIERRSYKQQAFNILPRQSHSFNFFGWAHKASTTLLKCSMPTLSVAHFDIGVPLCALTCLFKHKSSKNGGCNSQERCKDYHIIIIFEMPLMRSLAHIFHYCEYTHMYDSINLANILQGQENPVQTMSQCQQFRSYTYMNNFNV